jgi:uncharacterized sodium:solute symporter family permease YidK
LTWPVIGLAMFAANISTVHLVSLAQSAYTSGLLYGNYEWMAGFTLILLSLFFAPLYLRTRVATLPDYLERRYNRNCRDALSFVSLISAIVIHIGVALFTAATVLLLHLRHPGDHSILGLNALMFFIVALGVLTGLYTVVGRPAGCGVDGEHPDRAAAGGRGLHHRGRLQRGGRLGRPGRAAVHPAASAAGQGGRPAAVQRLLPAHGPPGR